MRTASPIFSIAVRGYGGSAWVRSSRGATSRHSRDTVASSQATAMSCASATSQPIVAHGVTRVCGERGALLYQTCNTLPHSQIAKLRNDNGLHGGTWYAIHGGEVKGRVGAALRDVRP